MDAYQTSLLVGAVLVALFSWRLPRALFWIVIGGAAFVASSVYWNQGLPYPAAFAGLCDLVVCFIMYAVARQRWEMRVWNCFHGMLLVNILYLAKLVPSHFMYGAALDLFNWLALAIIGGAAALQMADSHGVGHGSGGFARGWLRSVSDLLFAPRKERPFWERP